MSQQNNWKEELETLGRIAELAQLETAIKWGHKVYTYGGKNVFSFAGFKNHFSIWFYNGVFLKDPYKVLVAATEGKTKSLRQWRFTSLDQLNEEYILQYINEAIEIEKKGLKIPPQKTVSIETPAILEHVLSLDPEYFQAFQQLTPGRQKEYILYISEAKQDATKLKRMDKIKPMILAGQALNDKYKK